MTGAEEELADLRQRLAGLVREWRASVDIIDAVGGTIRGNERRRAANEIEQRFLDPGAAEEARLRAAVDSAGDRRDWDACDEAEERLEAFKRKRRAAVAEPVSAYGAREE